MKAKHLMTMVALPALFAACAQEELVLDTASNLEGRALLDPNFSIKIEGQGIDSRFSWNESAWGWNEFTAEDKFSAGLVDDLVGGVQNKVLTNYVFSSANGGESYTTTSQMVEGTYFFYSYPEFEKSESSAAVAFDLTSQTKIDLTDAAATVNENQLFVSPLYKLSAGHANIELPLYFVSYWSTAGLKIKNTTGEAFKIRRITLSDATGRFVVKGTINKTKLNTAGLKYQWSADAEAYVLPTGKANSNLLTLDIADATTTQDVITVDCQAYELANGEEVTAYIQVPAGRHTSDVTVEMVIETQSSLGTTILKSVEFVYADNADSNADGVNDAVDFKRGYTIPAYGIENGGIKAYEIDKIKLTGAETAEGVYADSYEALEAVLLEAEQEQTSSVDINNLGALKVNDDVMYLLSNLRYAKPNFLNAIEITSISKGTVKNAVFKEGATVVAGDITIGEGVEVAGGKTLTVNEGAAATINNGTFTGAAIANNGTLTLNVTAVPSIYNGAKSSMIVDADVTLKTADVNAPKYLTINAGKTLTADEFTIDYNQTVTNRGTIAATNAADFVINGTVENYGTIENGSLTALVDQNSDGVAEPATINNYGVIAEINVDNTEAAAEIVQKSANAEINRALGSGTVNNTENGIVTDCALTVYAEYSGDQTGKLGDVMSATKVILKNGTWTNPELPTTVTALDLSTVILTGDNAIALNNVKNLSLTSCTVSKDLSMTGVATATLSGSIFNAPVTMDNASFTTVNLKGMTINYPFVTAATAINIKGGTSASDVKTTTIAAELSHDSSLSTLTVEANAKLLVTSNGSLGSTGTTTVTNNGSVENRGHIYGIDTPATGWKGNAVE